MPDIRYPGPVTEPRPLDIKWILIGFAIQGGLSWLLTSLLFEPVATPMVEAMGATGGMLTFVLLVVFGAFFGGGLLVAVLSPGDTTKEPAIAAALAIVFNAVMNLARVDFAVDGEGIVGILIAGACAFGFALAGAKVGEKIQGDTTDKMRDRGELGG